MFLYNKLTDPLGIAGPGIVSLSIHEISAAFRHFSSERFGTWGGGVDNLRQRAPWNLYYFIFKIKTYSYNPRIIGPHAFSSIHPSGLAMIGLFWQNNLEFI